MKLALLAKELFTPLERIDQPLVLLEDGVISGIPSFAASSVPKGHLIVDMSDAILVPGFIDMHIHGGGGYDVMNTDAKALASVERLLASHGVTSYFPTTVTAPMDVTLAALDNLASAIENAQPSNDDHRARPVGIHLEGPFISHVRPGVHPPGNLHRPTLNLFEKFWEALRATVKVMTIAPELEGAREVIAEAALRGVCVSMGEFRRRHFAGISGREGGRCPRHQYLQREPAPQPPQSRHH